MSFFEIGQRWVERIEGNNNIAEFEITNVVDNMIHYKIIKIGTSEEFELTTAYNFVSTPQIEKLIDDGFVLVGNKVELSFRPSRLSEVENEN